MIDWLRAQQPVAADVTADVSESDADLIARARVDRAAFGVLFDRHAESVYRYCYRRLGDRNAAEDATSQVFTRAMLALPGYRERRGSSFVAWLFAIAHNVATDATRRDRRHAPLDAAAGEMDTGPTVEEAVLGAEEARSVRALLLALPPDQRRAMELRLAGLTGPEIADVLGRSHRAVKMLQFRAIGTLRSLLGVPSARTKSEDDQP
ncbi:MAG TPA: sigma-70 family RNA polymerase sigma factor [Thermomicrobiales bacterium]